MDKKTKIIKISTILTCIVMFISIIILTFQFVKIANLREKSRNLETYKSELIQDITTYDSANTYYNNRTEYLENYAREVLGWGQENDIWYTSPVQKWF